MTTETTLSNEPLRYTIGKHPNTLANLAKGRANLAEKRRNGFNGNHEGYSVTSRLKQLLKEESNIIPPNANPNEKVYRDQIARTIVNRAAVGDVAMVKELLDRTEGKIAEPKLKELAETRIINIFVGTERAKELVDKLADRLLTGGINAQPENH